MWENQSARDPLLRKERMRIGVLLFIFAATLAASGEDPAAPKLPHFADYPVSEKWVGGAAPIKFQTSADRKYRTQFRIARQHPPNFAGHYSVATWGCGTQCIEGGIVDLATGQLITLPYPRMKDRWETWSFCQSAWRWSDDESDLGNDIETRPDSRLIILHCADAYKADGLYAHTFYFVFENRRFRRIADRIGDERVN